MIFSLLHPLLFALYGPMALLAQNLGEVPVSSVGRAVVLSAALGTVLVLGNFWLVRDWHKAGIFSSLALVFFFSYGHVYTIVKNFQLGTFIVGRHRYLMPIGLLLLIICSLLVARRKADLRTTTHLLTFMAVASFLFPIYSIARYELRG